MVVKTDAFPCPDVLSPTSLLLASSLMLINLLLRVIRFLPFESSISISHVRTGCVCQAHHRLLRSARSNVFRVFSLNDSLAFRHRATGFPAVPSGSDDTGHLSYNLFSRCGFSRGVEKRVVLSRVGYNFPGLPRSPGEQENGMGGLVCANHAFGPTWRAMHPCRDKNILVVNSTTWVP